MAEYTGPLNYITMVEALKNGTHTMTLLCINSSLKQPPPSGKMLNDCLMKGSSVLMDQFTENLMSMSSSLPILGRSLWVALPSPPPVKGEAVRWHEG
jgi:hypothetical protein